MTSEDPDTLSEVLHDLSTDDDRVADTVQQRPAKKVAVGAGRAAAPALPSGGGRRRKASRGAAKAKAESKKPGADGVPDPEEARERRKQANREAAKRSKDRKKAEFADLRSRHAAAKAEHDALCARLEALQGQVAQAALHERMLRQQLAEGGTTAVPAVPHRPVSAAGGAASR